jgi:branched-chain amino acid transport system substrate-binding protein
VIITKAWANEDTGISLMMTAAEASPLYLQPSGAAAEGVLLQSAMGVIGDLPRRRDSPRGPNV